MSLESNALNKNYITYDLLIVGTEKFEKYSIQINRSKNISRSKQTKSKREKFESKANLHDSNGTQNRRQCQRQSNAHFNWPLDGC